MAKSRFKELFRRACLESSILGFKYLFLYPDKFSRIFWSVSIVSVFLWACILTQLLWNRFIELPTRISIENQFAPIFDIPFPSMAVCTPNQMARSHVQHLRQTLIDGDTAVELEKALPSLLGFYEEMSLEEAWRLTDVQNLLELNRYEMREVMTTLPQSCARFLRACYWEGERADCSALFRPLLTEHGLCCVFNSPYKIDRFRTVYDENFKPLSAAFPFFGASHGLTLVTDYDPDDALPRTLLNEGANQLLFYDPSDFPYSDELTLVPPHVESYHEIHATVINCSEQVASLPIESRKCVFEDEYQLTYFHKYRNSQCDMDCFMTEMFRKCHCVLMHAPLRGPTCNATSIPCLVNTRTQLANNTSALQSCDCPRECMSRKYRIKSNLGNLDALEHLFHDQYDGVNFSSSTTIMHIFYQNPFYVVQKQEIIMSYINLISNLGGVFGLCLGCSVMSVLEIVFYVCRAIRISRRRRRAAARWRHLKMIVLYQKEDGRKASNIVRK